MTTKPKTRKAHWRIGQEVRSRNTIIHRDVAMARGENRSRKRCECFFASCFPMEGAASS